MTRGDFKKILKIRSQWKTGKGNYKLPSGESLLDYLQGLAWQQMELDHLGINSAGDLVTMTGGEWDEEAKAFKNWNSVFGEVESCTAEDMEKRVKALAAEIL